MPKGIDVVIDDGMATIDFVDPALRGPGLTRLLETAGPGLIETLTGSGPRRQYRVPEGNAREAGLLDDVRPPVPRSAGADSGYAAALSDSGPNSDPAVSRPEPTVNRGYVGQTPNDEVMGGVSVSTTTGSFFPPADAALPTSLSGLKEVAVAKGLNPSGLRSKADVIALINQPAAGE